MSASAHRLEASRPCVFAALLLCLSLGAAAGCRSDPPDRVVQQELGPAGLSDEAWGARLFASYGCHGCHTISGAGGIGGHLDRLWGTERTLHDGTLVLFDEAYARESLEYPNARIVQGFEAVMPSYRDLLNEAETLALIAFLRSLE
ncbi:MAG: cytochrome c [Myxococcales bacterium]|nr:cytochrome c [Myxococcales bacterium]